MWRKKETIEITEQVAQIIADYKYAGLYALFVIDTLGVFLPSKSILTLTGILVESGQLRFGPLFLAAFTGSLTGFCISYGIGLKLGKPFFFKYGKYLRISAHKIEKAERWFNRYGPVFIVAAYFTPGIRHITPYLSGIAGMAFSRVIIFASMGAALWITTFVSLGRFFGQRLDWLNGLLDRYQWWVLLVAVLVLLLITGIRRYNRKSAPPDG